MVIDIMVSHIFLQAMDTSDAPIAAGCVSSAERAAMVVRLPQIATAATERAHNHWRVELQSLVVSHFVHVTTEVTSSDSEGSLECYYEKCYVVQLLILRSLFSELRESFGQ